MVIVILITLIVSIIGVPLEWQGLYSYSLYSYMYTLYDSLLPVACLDIHLQGN